MFVKTASEDVILYHQLIMTKTDFFYYFQEDSSNKIYGYSPFVFMDDGKHIPDVGFKMNGMYYGLINKFFVVGGDVTYDIIFKYKHDHITFPLTEEDLEKIENGWVPVITYKSGEVDGEAKCF